MNADDAKADLLAALNAERYGTGQWFTTHQPGTRRRPMPGERDIFDDSETTTARRRRALLAAVDHTHETRTA